jgi:hypothetical protein
VPTTPDDQIKTVAELRALYERLDELVAEVRTMQAQVSKALDENRRRDQQRVTPETRTTQRARHNR